MTDREILVFFQQAALSEAREVLSLATDLVNGRSRTTNARRGPRKPRAAHQPAAPAAVDPTAGAAGPGEAPAVALNPPRRRRRGARGAAADPAPAAASTDPPPAPGAYGDDPALPLDR